jgi:hypothetical protein
MVVPLFRIKRIAFEAIVEKIPREKEKNSQ